jgi:wyosine [tRNA(Phe)-imidazoG37] synthetase (radical SAM superfamily)
MVGAHMIVFGPVPSRRLGRSIGINNIPAKTCTYSCIYCQLGRTRNTVFERRSFYDPQKILAETKTLVQSAMSKGERIDYLTFVPDGEPTLDINLQREIELLRELGLPIAILTNSSLISHSDVREALYDLDLVSLKVDAVSERMWKRINRPHKELSLERIMDGIDQFSAQFEGTIITETMLVDGVDYSDEIDKIAEFLAGLNMEKAYIAVPTRPPAEDWVKPAKEEILNQAFLSFSDRIGSDKVELLIGYEGDAFSSTGNLEEDLLSITSVHPMRKDAVEKLAEKSGASWERVQSLLDEGSLIELRYEEEAYYMRKLPSR